MKLKGRVGTLDLIKPPDLDKSIDKSRDRSGDKPTGQAVSQPFSKLVEARKL